MSGFEIGRSQVQPPAGIALGSPESMILKIAIESNRHKLLCFFKIWLDILSTCIVGSSLT